MPIKITLTVETTNHGNAIEFTETYTDSGGNPRYDGDTVIKRAAALTHHVVTQLDKLVASPIRTGDRQ